MIIEFVRYFVSIAGMGVLWYLLDGLVVGYIDDMVLKYPSLYPIATVAFVKAITHWFIFLVIIGLTYSLFVVAQRTRAEGYY